MRAEHVCFALGLGLGFPCLPAAFGAELPMEQSAALLLLGFSIGVALPAALDLLGRWARAEEDSQRRQRDALSGATEVATAERWAKLEAVEAPEPDLSAEDEWYTHTLRPLFTNGHRAGGFSHGLLGGTMYERDWEDLCKFYISAVGRHVLRLEPGNVGYVLNTPTWTHAAVMREIAAHTLPHPEGLAPDVETLTDDAARRAARRGETVGQGGAVEGTVTR